MINIKTSQQAMANGILRELVSQIDKEIKKFVNTGIIKDFLSKKVRDKILNSPEYYSLAYGDLARTFNIISIQNDVEKIITTISNSLQVDYQAFRALAAGLSGKIAIRFFRSDLSDVLSLRLTSLVNEQEIEWLKFLLTSDEFTFTFDVGFNAESEIPLTIEVPIEFRGNIRDNWLTRALTGLEGELQGFLESELSRRL